MPSGDMGSLPPDNPFDALALDLSDAIINGLPLTDQLGPLVLWAECCQQAEDYCEALERPNHVRAWRKEKYRAWTMIAALTREWSLKAFAQTGF